MKKFHILLVHFTIKLIVIYVKKCQIGTRNENELCKNEYLRVYLQLHGYVDVDDHTTKLAHSI